jgi:hypothetical protein
MIKARPKYPTDLYGTIYIDNIVNIRLCITAFKLYYQLLAHGRWFSPASSTTKTSRHDIAEILLKVVLSTIN